MLRNLPWIIFSLVFLGHSWARAKTFGMAELRQVLTEQKVDSVEKALALLPENLRSKYVLLFQSRSLQGATPEAPRVILYGDEAKFLVAFNGAEKARGFNEIEVAEFNNEKKNFDFYEVQFPDPLKARTGIEISQANPDKCLKCHGPHGHAIWEAHPIWPGAYGQIYHAPLVGREEAGLAAFLALQPTHPRYKYLQYIDAFAKRESLAPTTHDRYEGRDSHLPPNAAFGQFLSDLNLQWIAKSVALNPDFPKYQYALLAALDSDCGSVEAYVPPAEKAEFRERLQRVQKITDESNERMDSMKRIRLRDLGKVNVSQKERVDLVPFRALTENGLGLSTDSWGLALESKSYDFTASNTAIKVLEKDLLKYVLKNDPELRKTFALRSVSTDDRYCEELRRKSLQQNFKLKAEVSGHAPERQVANVGASTLVKTCVGCHDDSVAYAFPFDQPAELAKLMDAGQFPRGHLRQEILYRLSPEAGDEVMPRAQNLAPEERQILKNYFESIPVQKK